MNSRLAPDLIRGNPSTPPGSHVLNADSEPCLLSQKQREDLVGDDFLNGFVMEVGDMEKNTIRDCAYFGHQAVNMGIEVDSFAEGLDHGHYSRHDLMACGCVQKFHK